jgi:ribosomal protein S18 acetylase RimI-like enzyme
MAQLRSVPMTASDYGRWLDVQVEGYGQSHLRAGDWDANHATALSRAEFDRLLPQGLGSPGHTLRILVDATTGVPVGSVWWYIPPAPNPGVVPSLFIYWLGIDEAFRRRGYGRAALLLVEREATAAGLHFVDLHVFADNPEAIRLYRSSGFEPTGMRMRRTLPPSVPSEGEPRSPSTPEDPRSPG